MKITIEQHNDQFNIALSSQEGKEPFMVIKGCRVKDGDKGPFISFPARKMDNGKWWNHVWASEGFQKAALLELQKAAPPRRAPPQKTGFDDIDNDIPF